MAETFLVRGPERVGAGRFTTRIMAIGPNQVRYLMVRFKDWPGVGSTFRYNGSEWIVTGRSDAGLVASPAELQVLDLLAAPVAPAIA